MTTTLLTRLARPLQLIAIGLALPACGRGLPPEPPGRDAADPGAAIPRHTPGPRSLDRSAFSEAALRGESDDGGGHMDHGHHGHGHETTAPAKPGASGGHEGHTAPAKPGASGEHEGHTAPARETSGKGQAGTSESEAHHHAP